MKQIQTFIQSHKYAILWTIGYVFLMWLILDKMFNFPMFSAAAWNKLMHAHLRGFGGFVFGILILAALPLYVATTTVIVRTGKPLFSIPLPNWIKNLYTPSASASDDKKETAPETVAPNSAPSYDIPRHMPTELHGPYLRARMRKSYQKPVTTSTPAGTQGNTPAIAPAATPVAVPIPTAVPTIQNAVAPSAPTATAGELPLPTDFDFDTSDTPTFDIPMFKDISFDDDVAIDIKETNDSPAASDKSASAGAVADFLNSTNRKFSQDGDLIICDDMAIASHEDPDFWIADENAWFASGKQRPSPIAALQSAAARGLRPVLYLGAKNILDMEDNIATWQSAGITIIESPDKLPN